MANGNFSACPEKMEEKLVYNITKVLFDYKSELVRTHKEANSLTLENALTGSPIPFHPGAAKYYREKKLKVKSD